MSKEEIIEFVSKKTGGKGSLLFATIAGSVSYGTNIETSDEDIRGVYIMDLDSVLGCNRTIYNSNYEDQISDKTNDVVLYELKRFLELVSTNNPNILELFNSPEDCVIYKHEIFDLLLEHKDKFITKICRDSFAGYAKQQISKAKGLNKKINWDKEKTTRKTVLDFCWVLDDYSHGALSLYDFCKNFYSKLKELELVSDNFDDESYEHVWKNIGLSKIPHSRDGFYMFYNWDDFYHCKGVITDKNSSNDVKLSSIPKGEKPIGTLFFNKDAYSIHCKNYKEFKEWEKKRNSARYDDTIKSGANYDGKNMMHCHRLLDMSLEILEGKGINVRRPNREELLSIRRGEYDYNNLLADVENKIEKMDKLFNESSLPKSVDEKFVHDLLVKVRRVFYSL